MTASDCVHVLDVAQDLLAVVVVLVEPAHDLVGAHQIDGAERLPQHRLEEHGRSPVMFEPFETFDDMFFSACALTSALLLW